MIHTNGTTNRAGKRPVQTIAFRDAMLQDVDDLVKMVQRVREMLTGGVAVSPCRATEVLLLINGASDQMARILMELEDDSGAVVSM
jgi:hypothetical protein